MILCQRKMVLCQQKTILCPQSFTFCQQETFFCQQKIKIRLRLLRSATISYVDLPLIQLNYGAGAKISDPFFDCC
jgi:hypothetical protein